MTIPLLPDSNGDCTMNLRTALRDPHDEVVTIDLERVPYLTSGALTELVRFHRQYRENRIVLRHPNALVLRTLHTVGFNKLFAIEQDAA
jgi:anti-anti-sigma regulatory factor